MCLEDQNLTSAGSRSGEWMDHPSTTEEPEWIHQLFSLKLRTIWEGHGPRLVKRLLSAHPSLDIPGSCPPLGAAPVGPPFPAIAHQDVPSTTFCIYFPLMKYVLIPYLPRAEIPQDANTTEGAQAWGRVSAECSRAVHQRLCSRAWQAQLRAWVCGKGHPSDFSRSHMVGSTIQNRQLFSEQGEAWINEL